MLPVAEEEGLGDSGGRNPLQERRGGARGSLGLDLAGLSLEEVEKAEEGEVGDLVTQKPAAGSGRGRRRAETAAPCQEMEALLRRFGKNQGFLGITVKRSCKVVYLICARGIGNGNKGFIQNAHDCFNRYYPTSSEIRSKIIGKILSGQTFCVLTLLK